MVDWINARGQNGDQLLLQSRVLDVLRVAEEGDAENNQLINLRLDYDFGQVSEGEDGALHHVLKYILGKVAENFGLLGGKWQPVLY